MQDFSSIQAVCFPFAGGNEYAYDQMGIFQSFDRKPARLPGRGTRMGETLLRSIQTMVDDFWSQPGFDPDKPYFLYGHSMGSLLAYEVALECKRRGIPAPLFLMVSGRQAPKFVDKHELPRHLMSKDSFWQEIKGYGGLPEVIFNEPELLDYFEPIIRADFEAVYNYRQREDLKLEIPVIALAGDQEKITDEELSSWNEVTTREFNCIKLPGNHFFIFDQAPRLKELVQASVKKASKVVTGYC